MLSRRHKGYSAGLSAALVLFALLSCPAVSVSGQTNKAPLTHETMWMMKRVGAPVPSPDGKWVVFSLVEPAYDEKDQVSDLWIVPADGSAKPRRLTSSKGGEGGVAWSTDSRKIAFSARREGDEVSQIYVLDVADGGEAVRITSLSTGARSPQWRPDGQALLFVSTVYPGAASQEVESSVTLRLGGTSLTVPLPGSRSSQPSPDQLAFVDAITSHLSVRWGQRPSLLPERGCCHDVESSTRADGRRRHR